MISMTKYEMEDCERSWKKDLSRYKRWQSSINEIAEYYPDEDRPLMDKMNEIISMTQKCLDRLEEMNVIHAS